MKVKDLLDSWSFIKDRVVGNNGSVTFCLKNSNTKVRFKDLSHVSDKILKSDAVREYTLRNDAFIVINMGY